MRVALACACAFAALAAAPLAASAQLAASPDPLDVGDVVVSETGAGTVTIENTGGSQVTIDGCSLQGSTDFSLANSCPATLDGGATHDVAVDFTPQAVGAQSDTLQVDYDGGSTVTAGLQGRGVKPDITVTPTTPIDFGDQAVGTTSAPVTITVENDNQATTSVLSVTILVTGTDAADFSAAPQVFTLDPGQSQGVDVTFSPQDFGARSATLEVQSDDQETPLIAIDLSGNGLDPRLTLQTPGPLDFGDVLVGDTSGAQQVTIENTGNDTLTVSDRQIVGTDADSFSITSGPSPAFDLGPGATATWDVVCTPQTTGALDARFRIDSNDDLNTPAFVELDCNGTQPNLVVSPAPVQFPGTRLGETAAEITVTLENGGSAPLTITDVSSSNSVFPITTMPSPSLSATLQPGETVTLGLSFTPQTNTSYSGTLDVLSDDPNGAISVTVTGQGLLTEMQASPATHDFGDVRVDQPGVSQTFTLENTGEAPFVLQGISIDDTTDFGLITGAFGVVLGVGDTYNFSVLARPQTVGAKSATVTVTTDIPNGAVTTLDVSADGVAPEMGVEPASIDFGGVDVQAAEPAVQSVTVANTGTATLSVSDIRLEDAQGQPYQGEAFSLGDTGALPIDVSISSSIEVEVSYAPALEGAADEVRLVVEGDGLGQMSAAIPISGRGIDRHIQVMPANVIEFPPTYRNPEQPATLDLQVLNTGEAPLSLSMVTKQGSGSGAFSVTPQAVEVAGASGGQAGSETLQVSFAPTAASGEPFAAELFLINDDDERPMVRVELRGRGILPEMALTPGILDFGRVGVGVAAPIPDGSPPVRLVNAHASRTFEVREIRVVSPEGEPMDEVFRLVGADAPRELGPMETLELGVEFTPERAGVHRGELQVFVEGDPEPLAFVLLRGEAVDASLRGGGCRAAGGGGALGALLLLGLLFALRRRPGAAAAALSLCAFAGPAAADPARDVDVGTFRPAPAVEPALISVESPEVSGDGAWGTGLILSHALRPLVVESSSVLGMTDVPIEARTAAELLFAYGLGDRYEVGAGLPLLAQSGERPSFSGIEPAEGTALGDLALHGRMRLLEAEPLALAASTTATLPTATGGAFAGSDWPTLHARAIAGLESRRIRLAVNAGFRLRRSAALADVEQGNELTYGVGAAYRVQGDLAAVGELFGALGLAESEILGVSPLEVGGGVRYRPWRQVSVVGGLGRGLLSGVGAPDLRAFLRVSYAPGASAPEPLVAPREIDRGDDDGDEVPNFADGCPRTAEDEDGFEDDDGCPDVDNDRDNLADERDQCPLEPEDQDGHEDEDGCPDGDNDGDGVADGADECPEAQEDRDGFEDADGCPDPDNDRDGIPDVVDQCADEAETINGNADDDGCPDDGETLVMVLPDRIETYEPVRFRGRSARIRKRSENVLAQVAATLRANREILRLQIAVHVHPRGGGDQELSEERAAAVREWLLEWGIEPERLEVKGYGSKRPLSEKKGRRARRMNDRVEFILLERKVEASSPE